MIFIWQGSRNDCSDQVWLGKITGPSGQVNEQCLLTRKSTILVIFQQGCYHKVGNVVC